ncbi:MAG: hypothetical protein LVQ63_01670 [Thermoplasmatales archaeon]|nr:hypothetical protein [Thermoplasmatales archaeon]
MEKRRKGPGTSAVPPSDVVKVMLMQAYFGMPNRVAQGFLRMFGEKLGIPTQILLQDNREGIRP